MSKMDAVRAMREARYAEAQARAASPAKKAAPAKATPTRASAAKATAPEEDAPQADGLCGHRNMSGRTCTREQGHPQKSHRYA
ncbi:hypothetical protein G5V59_03470 [Nocardioides sp. W3-2-3]|uniref:hypothetical protein n=1 Tax=Nocardioides convexus TaxID=2712224 RepID=UPI002418249B|nr:hypothetical protein [Nocardioides convexus]NGZ99737.1 hypothetical protein [Nocardioides convexus]